MQLRNGALAGGSPGQLPADRRPAFEEGVLVVFKRWTALCLALDGQWGGSSSADKAQTIYEETLDWFYKKKGGPEESSCTAAVAAMMLCAIVTLCSTHGMQVSIVLTHTSTSLRT